MPLPITVTQAEIDALVSAIASGALTVSHGGKSVTYANAADLRDRLRLLQQLASSAPSLDTPRIVYLKRRG